jgi:prepilin-type N-terminal cleavage/methylation domain-containing protein
MRGYKSKQSGFTLVEIAIVLVIIGLLLGGVLKGQAMISNAKVKTLANEIKAISAAYYGYQDRYRAIPGDDAIAITHLGATVNGVTILNATASDGLINTGTWIGNATPIAGNESSLFWQHTRAAGFLTGNAAVGNSNNAMGGLIGITSVRVPTGITGGTVFVCTGALAGDIAPQLDTIVDDGLSASGGMQARLGVAITAAGGSAATYVLTSTYTNCTGI